MIPCVSLSGRHAERWIPADNRDMSNQNRNPKGAPASMGGKFAEGSHDEADSALSPSMSFGEILTTVTREDLDYAVESRRVTIGNRLGNNWDHLMGTARRTEGNITTYNKKLDRIAASEPDHKKEIRTIASQRARQNAFARAYDQGVEIHPVAEAYFEETWTGDGPFGEVATRNKLADYSDLLPRVESGEVSGSKIVGSSYRNPRKVAIDYIKRSIADAERAIETRGRSTDVIVSNAYGRSRDADWV